MSMLGEISSLTVEAVDSRSSNLAPNHAGGIDVRNQDDA